MFARSVTISRADTSAIDQGIGYVRDDVMPELMQLGCVGMSLVVDRESGHVITTSSWDTQQARDSSKEAMAPYRSKAAEMLDGKVSIADWEVALMHRDHDAFDLAACRITWARTPDIDGLLERYRSMMLPVISEAMGFCSASMFVDRELGTVCGTTTFDSRATMEASRARAEANRGRARDVADVVFTDVREFDLVLAHLRVPELV
jgi:hypothetical protein